MAPFIFPRGDSDSSIHPGIYVLATLAVVVPIGILLIYRRRIWLSPLWKPISYKLGKRRYEADKRKAEQGWVDIKPSMVQRPTQPRETRQVRAQYQESPGGAVIPTLNYQQPPALERSLYSAQPMQRSSPDNRYAVSHAPVLTPMPPPPPYSAPHIAPPPAAAARYPSRHAPRAPSKRADTPRLKKDDPRVNPFYPDCVNQQADSGSRFVEHSIRAVPGRRLN
ncbi:hypothetical protein PC9H_007245 [Pleurotus ostreatus]|uniref:Uncharacterized protein n=2 Tax=Pleurotus ostreatus TaxID=5322 RepID=A0A067NKE0_PLEO1|nr:uncharacterized protein PC9H_007245 [Pleurotus ostreatus]KAF7428026.1 hypothetical protein PC9H_007245 [Pleurotus ostreatus]KAJ8696073.1 hypothetical protein PTI98_005971 [Pleurotus ostreatus]KDQ27500.1 hypothetical protein PLEOSDRAFT_158616 [Pleurotus ostreatus PC15]